LLQILNFKIKIMQKNWYIVYTKPGSEKKVASIFSKKKIENLFPVSISKSTKAPTKRKSICTPLFNSYVFINTTEIDILRVKKIEGVVGLVYWKGGPAIVTEEEIGAIKEFISDYQTVHVEKTTVNPNESVHMVSDPQYAIEGNLLTIKPSLVKIKLPSLGYTMIAEIRGEDRLGSEVSFGKKELLLQS
jgi:transcription antitermination factor NusG